LPGSRSPGYSETQADTPRCGGVTFNLLPTRFAPSHEEEIMYSLFGMFGLGGPEILLLVVLGVLLFGRKLPEVGRSIGKTVVEFKKGVGGLEDEVREASSPRAAIDPEPVKAPQRVTPATPKPTFDDAPAAPSVPPKV
jgi:sec-independent protein translocase protein TatA